MNARLVFLVVTLLLNVTFARDAQSTVLQASGKAYVGKALPDFAGIDLSRSGAEVLALQDILDQAKILPDGRVVLVFFATTCVPCREGLLAMQAQAAQLKKDGVVVLMVAVGGSGDETRAFIAANKLGFPCVWDKSGQVSRNFGVIPEGGDLAAARVPLTAVADGKGKLLRVITAEGDDYLDLVRKGK